MRLMSLLPNCGVFSIADGYASLSIRGALSDAHVRFIGRQGISGTPPQIPQPDITYIILPAIIGPSHLGIRLAPCRHLPHHIRAPYPHPR